MGAKDDDGVVASLDAASVGGSSDDSCMWPLEPEWWALPFELCRLGVARAASALLPEVRRTGACRNLDALL